MGYQLLIARYLGWQLDLAAFDDCVVLSVCMDAGHRAGQRFGNVSGYLGHHEGLRAPHCYTHPIARRWRNAQVSMGTGTFANWGTL